MLRNPLGAGAAKDFVNLPVTVVVDDDQVGLPLLGDPDDLFPVFSGGKGVGHRPVAMLFDKRFQGRFHSLGRVLAHLF